MQTTTLTRRIQVIDFTRGLALFGILIINIQTYALFFFLMSPEQVFDQKLDTPATFLPLNFMIRFLVEGQFYTTYSFLFGLGFYPLISKYNSSGLDGNKLFRRRMWILLVIGLVHGILFWFGDILHKYALLGFTLLYFNKKSTIVLLRWIAGLALFVIVFNVIKYSFFITEQRIAHDAADLAELVGGFIQTWKQGSIVEVSGAQKFGVLVGHMINLITGFFYYIHYEIMFLLGLIVGRLQLLNNSDRYKPLMKRWLLYTLPAGLLLKAISCLPFIGIALSKNTVHQELAVTLLQFIAVPILTLSYLILITLLFPAQPSPLVGWIANTGRLGLTNYLAQTLICMMLFYGYAGGLSGKLTLWQTMVVATLIYTAQVVFSNMWLRKFSVGPMESLWARLAMYRKTDRKMEAVQG